MYSPHALQTPDPPTATPNLSDNGHCLSLESKKQQSRRCSTSADKSNATLTRIDTQIHSLWDEINELQARVNQISLDTYGLWADTNKLLFDSKELRAGHLELERHVNKLQGDLDECCGSLLRLQRGFNSAQICVKRVQAGLNPSPPGS